MVSTLILTDLCGILQEKERKYNNEIDTNMKSNLENLRLSLLASTTQQCKSK